MSLRHIGLAAAIVVLTVGIRCEGAQPTPSPLSSSATPLRPTATPAPPTATATPMPSATSKPTVQILTPEMVLVEAGSFQMGSTSGRPNEQPVHTVRITRSFYISKYEVTLEQYDGFCDDAKGVRRPRDFGWGRGPRPAIVRWYDAVAYCNWLSEKEGLPPCYSGKGRLIQCDFAANGYRLPTEAEWEYAARGGCQSQGYQYAGSDDPDEVAWYGANSGGQTHPVGRKEPNELGLYDMSGNAWEWCWDWYNDEYYASSPASDPMGPIAGNRDSRYGSDRVLRGGNYLEDEGYLRVAYRSGDWPTYDGEAGGTIRLVRTNTSASIATAP